MFSFTLISPLSAITEVKSLVDAALFKMILPFVLFSDKLSAAWIVAMVISLIVLILDEPVVKVSNEVKVFVL